MGVNEILIKDAHDSARNLILKDLPEYEEKILKLFATHKEPKYYDLRGVALFGVSECIRAKKFIELLENSKYKEIGEMMKIIKKYPGTFANYSKVNEVFGRFRK